MPELAKLRTQVLGVSVDSSASHLAFADKLGVTFPLLSDIHRRVSRSYGVLLEEQSISCRATFIIDQQGIIRQILINDLGIRRSEQEILRVLRAMDDAGG